MLLKVGELARHSGLTVRTLHHYDEIGLLKPTGRSDSGYRLYSRADVARLHGVQALRHLGLALADIGAMLDGQGASPAMILEQQVRALDRQIDQATELRERLGVMQFALSHGDEPDMASWLETLALMATYGKYFSAAELKIILGNWKRIEGDWQPLVDAVRGAMNRGLGPDALEVQPLAHRWMGLMLRWMDGNFDLIDRWGDMYDKEPSTHNGPSAPASDMVAFIRSAIDTRMALLVKYLAIEEVRRFQHVADADWQSVSQQAAHLIDTGIPAGSAEARAVAQVWLGLLDRVVGHQPGVLEKLLRAHANEPLLRAGSSIGTRQSTYLRAALDPHAT